MTFASFFPEEEERPFVDREEFIQAFKDALGNIREKERSVLVYHGVGGIGKTSLRKEFPKVIEKHNESHRNFRILWAAVDFETEEFRQSHKFLEILRDQLQEKYRVRFHTFDIAHAIYWTKVNPRIPLHRENYAEDSIVTQLLDIGGEFSQVKLLPNIGKLVKSFPDLYREWELKSRKEISRLISMEPAEIEKRLYRYWAYDLHEYLQKTSESAVIFIDSYEALWGKDQSLASLSSKDEWVRKLIQSLLSSSCLWVLCGRKPPRWEEYSDQEKDVWENSLGQHNIKGLPEEDARHLLKCCDVLEKDIQDTIISGSAGVPYYLDLAIYTYKNIKKSREPEPGDFAKVPKEVFNRFIRYLDEDKEEAIKILSVPRFWNREIFNALIQGFTSYRPNELTRIHSFSFIDEIEEGKWSMHQLMRQSWQEYQEREGCEERKDVHQFMLDYYTKKLENIDIKEITPEHETALMEAFYHAKETLEAEKLFEWVEKYSDSFTRAALWQLIIPTYEELLTILNANLGPQHLSVTNTLNDLALLYYQMGEYKKALPLYKRALDIREKMLGLEHPHVAIPLNNLAALYLKMGEYEKALPLFKRALETVERVLGPEHPHVAITLNNLAELYRQMGAYDKALPLYKRDLEISERSLGPEHPDIAGTLNNLGLLYQQMGEYKKALPIYKRALEIREKVLGSEHPHVATTLNNLAELYRQMGEYEKALLIYKRTLEIVEKVLGSEHPDIAGTLNNLALLYCQMGKYEKALPIYKRALKIHENILDPEHPDIANTLNNLAALYERTGEYEKALPIYKRALETREKVLGSEHPDVVATLNNLAELYRQMGEYEKALPIYKQTLEIVEKVLGPQHPYVATTLNNLGLLYHQMGEYEKALPLYKQALETREKVLEPEHPHVMDTLNNLGLLYHQMGEYEKALPLYNRTLEITEGVLGPEHPHVIDTLNNLAALHYHLEEHENALPLFERLLETSEKVFGPEHPYVATTLNNLAGLYEKMGEYEKAPPLYNRALEIVEKTLGTNHPNYKIFKDNLEGLRGKIPKD